MNKPGHYCPDWDYDWVDEETYHMGWREFCTCIFEETQTHE